VRVGKSLNRDRDAHVGSLAVHQRDCGGALGRGVIEDKHLY